MHLYIPFRDEKNEIQRKDTYHVKTASKRVYKCSNYVYILNHMSVPHSNVTLLCSSFFFPKWSPFFFHTISTL